MHESGKSVTRQEKKRVNHTISLTKKRKEDVKKVQSVNRRATNMTSWYVIDEGQDCTGSLWTSDGRFSQRGERKKAFNPKPSSMIMSRFRGNDTKKNERRGREGRYKGKSWVENVNYPCKIQKGVGSKCTEK